MVGVVVTYTVEEDQADRVAELFERFAEHVQETEPECVHWLAMRSDTRSNVFHLWEVYTTEEALQLHRETPHFKELIEDGVRTHVTSREADTGQALV